MSSSISSKNTLLKSVNNLHLHLYHLARGVYPAATGTPTALPVNRCLMVLEPDGDDISYVRDKNDRFVLQTCRVYFIPAHHTASVKLTEKLRFISIQFMLDFHNGIDLFAKFKKIIELYEPAWVERANRAFDTQEPHLLGVRVQSIIWDIVSVLFEQIDQSDLCLNMLPNFSAADPGSLYESCTAETTVAELADKCGIGRDSFSRNFIRKYGISPKQFLNRCILQRAYSLLATENIKNYEVAQKLKFTNEFYFSRFFKKHTGMTPSQFRKKNLHT